MIDGALERTHELRGHSMTVAFLLTTLVVVATPGTGAVYTIGAGLARGRRASLIAALGCTWGRPAHDRRDHRPRRAANASAVAFQTLKWLGVAYLLYLAWQTLRDRSAIEIDTQRTPVSFWQGIGTAVLINLLNPKLTIFFFAFLRSSCPRATPTRRLTDDLAEPRVHGRHLQSCRLRASPRRCAGSRSAGRRGRVRRTFAATYVLLAGRLTRAGCRRPRVVRNAAGGRRRRT